MIGFVQLQLSEAETVRKMSVLSKMIMVEFMNSQHDNLGRVLDSSYSLEDDRYQW